MQRSDFRPQDVTPEQLQQIKLVDGVHCHEATKTALTVFARNNSLPVVKPFMLVVAQDTDHSREILEQIQSDVFFDGRYRDKVIEINSALRGEESEEATTKLLELEHTDETEIVIHVNKLKRVDVTNLYTIVPLRASASDILTEQTLSRAAIAIWQAHGDETVDRLTVVAHDRYDDVIRRANEPDSIVQVKSVIIGGAEGIPAEPVTPVSVPPVFMTPLTGDQATTEAGVLSSPDTPYEAKPPSEPIFSTQDDRPWPARQSRLSISMSVNDDLAICGSLKWPSQFYGYGGRSGTLAGVVEAKR